VSWSGFSATSKPEHRTTPHEICGPTYCENFETSLQEGLLTTAQFEKFCTKLCELLPDRSADCDRGLATDQIDTPELFYCQGSPLPCDSTVELSRVLELEGLLFAQLGRPPTDAEKEDAIQRWRQGLMVGSRSRLTLRGRRPFF